VRRCDTRIWLRAVYVKVTPDSGSEIDWISLVKAKVDGGPSDLWADVRRDVRVVLPDIVTPSDVVDCEPCTLFNVTEVAIPSRLVSNSITSLST